jgi:uncharacterized membrane protein YeiB
MTQTTQNVYAKQTTRIIGYDVARALAVIGMVIVNFKVAMGAEQAGPDWLVLLTNLLNGRAAAIFVILAGVGISLLSRRGRETNDTQRIRQNRVLLFRRAFFLFVVGLLYTPLWPADILHFYGVYIAIAALLLTVSNRKLWSSAIGVTFLFVLLAVFLDYEKGWDFTTLTYLDFWTLEGMVRHLFFNGFHPVLPWVAFMFIGMWLGRQDMTDQQVRKRILRASIGIAIAAETTSFAFVRLLPGEIGVLFDTAPLPPMPLYIMAGSGTALAIIILSIEATLRYPQARLFPPLVATGQLALTLYVAHVVLGMGMLETMGRLENQTLGFALLSSLIFCVFAIIFSFYWRRRYLRGPLEWIMRKTTG